MNTETDPTHLETTRADGSDGRIRVWRIVGQSFPVLFRNILPFLALVVGTWTAASWVITAFFRLFRPVVAAVCYRYIRVADGEIASD